MVGWGEGLTALGSYKWGTHHCWREIGDTTENLFQYDPAAVSHGIFSSSKYTRPSQYKLGMSCFKMPPLSFLRQLHVTM